MGKTADRTQTQTTRVLRRLPSQVNGREATGPETVVEVGWRAVCGASRTHGSEGRQGCLRDRLPYPTAELRELVQRLRERIGNSNGLLAPPPRPRLAHTSSPAPSTARLLRRSVPEPGGARRDFGWCWTGVSGWGRVAPQGCPGGKASGRATWDGWRGRDCKWDGTRSEG